MKEGVRMLATAETDALCRTLGALRRDRKFDEAEALLAPALRETPAQPDLLAEHVRLALGRGDHAAALARADAYRQRHPDRADAAVLAANALLAMKRQTEAEAILLPFVTRCPEHWEVHATYARCGLTRSEERLVRMQAVMRRFPARLDAVAGVTQALRSIGRIDEAAQLLAATLERHPQDLLMQVEMAHTLAAQGRYADAKPIWDRLRRQYPNNTMVQRAYQPVALQLAYLEVEHGSVPAAEAGARPVAAEAAELSPNDLVLSFEAMGDACEFGSVQRHFGAEPLGLLRWTGIAPANLVQGLNEGFEGVGAPEQTELRLSGTEYVSVDTRYNLRMHTFVHQSERPEAVFFPQLCKRQQYLRRKLLQDLEAGEKIFLYHRRTGMTEGEMHAVAKAIRAHGDNWLLCVVVHDPANPPGTVRELAPGLMVGYMTRLLNMQESGTACDFDTWLVLLRQAVVLWQARQPAADPVN